MKLKVVNEVSTVRGAIWFVGGLSALAFLAFSSVEKATYAMTVTATVAGAFGFGVTNRS